MAEVTVKLFGVYRSDTQIATTQIQAEKVTDLFDAVNYMAAEIFENRKKDNPALIRPEPIRFKDAIVYINGDKCTKKGRVLSGGEEIWIMSPASGG